MSMEGRRLIREGLEGEPERRMPDHTPESPEAKARGYVLHNNDPAFIRPIRRAYVHTTCTVGGTQITSLTHELAETYARDPGYYAATYCASCKREAPVSEFRWDSDGETVGS